MYTIPRTRIAIGLLHVAIAGTSINGVLARFPEIPGAIDYLTAIDGDNGKGPWGEPVSEFDAVLNSPNATGNFPITGPNISAPSSASSTIDGWSWSIAVAADFPLANSSHGADYRDKFYTGGTLALNAPSSLLSSSSQNLTVDDNWHICVFDWELTANGTGYPDKLRADNGTCLSVLSSECISDMEKEAKRNYSPGHCSCPIASRIPSCAALGDASGLWDSTCSGAIHNAARVRTWEKGRFELFMYGGAAHNRTNATAYNYMGSLAWPVMVSFYDGNEVTAELSCVRAMDAVPGSTAPTGDDIKEGSGGSRSSVEWYTLGAVLFALYALVL